MAFTYRDMGRTYNRQSIHVAEYEAYWLMGAPIINPWRKFHKLFSVFSVMAGWIVEMLIMLFFAHIAV